MVSVRGFPVVIAVYGSVLSPKALMASNEPPVIVPPEISIVPSSLMAAYSPALDKLARKSPMVVEVPTVIVAYSLLEFLTMTVCPFEMLIPSPKSAIRVSDVAVVVCVMIDLCERSPEI